MAVGCLDEKSEIKANKMFSELSEKLGSRLHSNINININEMDKVYYETDVFILTSKPNSESFGRTLVEAMSRKTVVLTTDAGGPVEIIRSKDNICITADMFVDKIMQLNSDKLLMEKEKSLNLIRVKEK